MWRPDPPEKIAHLDVDTAGRADGDSVLWDDSAQEHVYGPAAVGTAAVRDAGRWEVVVSGTPPVAVTNEAEDDWVYGWVAD